MTTPITFPSAALTPLGATLLAEGIDENLWVTFVPPSGGQPIIFYLKGGLSSIAPGVPGLDGIVIQSTSGLTADFKQIDLQAAHQDGVTNNGTVYDPALITLQGEMHAATPQGLDAVRDAWQGMWNPRSTCVMEYITIDGGYWRADVRLQSTWSDTIKYDRRYLYRPLTHKCRIDDAFWSGVPSTSQFLPSFETFGDTLSADAVTDPITVVQTAHGTTLPLSFADPVTVGNTVVVIVMGQEAGSALTFTLPEVSGPTLDGVAIPNAFPLWDSGLFDLQSSQVSLASSDNTVLSGWVLPNCPAANGISFSTFHPEEIGFVAYEVSGLGELPTIASAATAQDPGSTAVSSGTTPATAETELFVVGGASTFGGSSAGAAGFTNTEAASTAWAGYRIPTVGSIPPVTKDAVGGGFSVMNPLSTIQSWSHDVGSDANYLVAFVNVCTTVTPLCVATVINDEGETFVMTELGQVSMDFGEIVFAFGLANPPTGNVTVYADFIAITVFTLFGGNSVSLIGVGSVTDAVVANGSDSNPSLATTFAADQYVLNAIGAFNNDGGADVSLSDYNQTQLFVANNFGGEAILDVANYNTSLLIGDNSGSSDPSFSATVETVSLSETWCSLAIGFTPAQVFTWAQTESAADSWAAGVAALASSAQYGPLSARWDITYSSGHTGKIEIQEGVGAAWVDAGVNDSAQFGIARLQATDSFPTATTATDFQIVSIQIGDSFEGLTFGGEAATDIWGRLDDTNGNGVRCRIQDSLVTISRFNSGVETVLYTTALLIPPQQNEIWTFYLGADLNEPRSYSVSRSGFQLFGTQFDGHSLFPVFTEVGTGSLVGSSYRGVGFGMGTGVGVFDFAQAVSAPVAAFAAADNNDSAQTGFVQLSNIGTEEGGPQYLVTGPGVFGFGDGPGSATTISLGPLAAGQTAVVTTWPPRLRSVVDAADPTVNLYPLLSGRFQNSIPGVPLPQQAAPVQIPVSITSGSAASSIVATLTPRRIHPV